MFSVTKRIGMIKQPRSGYINKNDFKSISYEDGIELNETENINPSLIGLVVDYMTRYLMGAEKKEAFQISLLGAAIIKESSKAENMLEKINKKDVTSITYACKLVGYDVCYRAGKAGYKPVDEINPDSDTVKNISVMIDRSLKFWDNYGPVVKDGFTLEGGYTDMISSGDGDYLTKDTLWDFKVLKGEITPKHSLQLLVYYIMGKHSIWPEFNTIKHLGIFNPRLNKVYLLDVENIPNDTIETVSHDVIGYGKSKEEIYKELGLDYLLEIKKPVNTTSTKEVTAQRNFYDGVKQNQTNLTRNGTLPPLSYNVGDRVRHNKFGEGIVTAVVIGGRDYEVTVSFDKEGTKKMFASFAKLQKI